MLIAMQSAYCWIIHVTINPNCPSSKLWSFLPRCRLDDGGKAAGEKVPWLADVDQVEDDPLVHLGVFYRKVEPKPVM